MHNHDLKFNGVEHAKRKSRDKDAAKRPKLRWACLGMSGDERNCRIDTPNEVKRRPGYAGLIPKPRFCHVVLCAAPDDERIAH